MSENIRRRTLWIRGRPVTVATRPDGTTVKKFFDGTFWFEFSITAIWHFRPRGSDPEFPHFAIEETHHLPLSQHDYCRQYGAVNIANFNLTKLAV